MLAHTGTTCTTTIVDASDRPLVIVIHCLLTGIAITKSRKPGVYDVCAFITTARIIIQEGQLSLVNKNSIAGNICPIPAPGDDIIPDCGCALSHKDS